MSGVGVPRVTGEPRRVGPRAEHTSKEALGSSRLRSLRLGELLAAGLSTDSRKPQFGRGFLWESPTLSAEKRDPRGFSPLEGEEM